MTVYLVGAGPGDPDLLTLRAARLLGDADVVIHDRLVGSGVIDLINPWATRIDVGKDPNGRRTTQDRINELLIEHGERSDTVVRLKGGDPYVFGRGGEEVLALRRRGIDTQLVPGITSAIAGPAAAGVPVTHRGISSGFTVITAHQDPSHDRQLDWTALARLGTTLVILMGAARAAKISKSLRSAGMDPATPVAIVTDATSPAQLIERTSLVELGRQPVANPAVIVIGDVAALDLRTTAPNPTSIFPLTRTAGAAA